MAKALKEGLLPYKDFFFAHPPLQLLLLLPAILTNSFTFVKLYISIIGLSCIFLTYLIARKIFDEKSAFIASIAFLFFPGFLIFGNLAMGTFESLLFFLLSFYFLLNRKNFLSAFLFSLAFFTRYLSLLLFPFLLIYILKFQRKDLKKFLLYSLISNISFFLLFYFIFGYSFIKSTILYHFFVNVKFPNEIAFLSWQYFSLGFFTIFISLISLTFSYFKKEEKLFLFSFYPLIYDSIILLIFKQVIYHYFTFSLPFIFISFGRVFSSKSRELKIFLFLILFLSIFTNFKSITYYFDGEKNLVFKELVNYTFKLTDRNDLIFGSSIPTNYISFVTDRKIALNYFDSDLKHISFEGVNKVIEEIKKTRPKLIIADMNYYDIFYTHFENDYQKVKEWNLPNYYHLVMMKAKITK
jgi:4-amino-4-deoxy-L-arabinose transferase-like glycosyltransferase